MVSQRPSRDELRAPKAVATHSRRGILLLAHGSRDPDWRRPVEAIAERVRQQDPQSVVACGYLELCPPDTATAATQLVAAGAGSIRVVPLFLGMGKHAREDLPRLVDALRAAHPGLSVDLAPSLGEEPELVELAARLALSGSLVR